MTYFDSACSARSAASASETASGVFVTVSVADSVAEESDVVPVVVVASPDAVDPRPVKRQPVGTSPSQSVRRTFRL